MCLPIIIILLQNLSWNDLEGFVVIGCVIDVARFFAHHQSLVVCKTVSKPSIGCKSPFSVDVVGWEGAFLVLKDDSIVGMTLASIWASPTAFRSGKCFLDVLRQARRWISSIYFEIITHHASSFT